jgi:hypothetical protein
MVTSGAAADDTFIAPLVQAEPSAAAPLEPPRQQSSAHSETLPWA